jgi:hydroxylamine dehydrogenase
MMYARAALAALGIVMLLGVLLGAESPEGASAAVSKETKLCLVCHSSVSPGIVADWKRSLHSQTTPGEALKKKPLERRVSARSVPENLVNVVVGCAECHNRSPEKHKDTFDHGGEKVHVVVTPADCAACHPVETEQYDQNLMSHAYGNLSNNPVYHGLADSVNGIQDFDSSAGVSPASLINMEVTLHPPDAETSYDSCFYCHGTAVEVKGKTTRDTALGEMEFPVLAGWPNQGVGRLNPDDSMGSCTACHTRHQFSIEMARKPYTCSECHKGPDVPAYKVYMVSKHGNIFSSLGDQWNFASVPWVLGNDLGAPTCATCHVSLTVTAGGDVVAERTHRVNDRLSWRLFGLIYAHPHPKSPDTTVVKNKVGLPLPTELTGEPVPGFLIDNEEQAKRRETMQKVCLACHGSGWVEGQFARLDNTIKTTNEMTLTATKIVLTAWEKGAAKGLSQKDSIFNETIEKKWVEQWLFFANSTRFASAMMGADYGVFANGRWYLSKNIQEMLDWLNFKLDANGEEKRK